MSGRTSTDPYGANGTFSAQPNAVQETLNAKLA